MQNVLLIGFGFMGRTHAGIYARLPDVRVTGIVDNNGKLSESILNENHATGVPVFADLASAVSAVDVSVVDICLPTDLHCGIAQAAFAAGKHVFCEKPIALKREEATLMIEAARRADRQFMVGHCIRFWPEYVALREMTDSGAHGRLVSLSMIRRTGRPNYSVGDWVNQPERCRGAALDLHIHDVDFLLHLLGHPEGLVSQGLRDETGWNTISTQYAYAGRRVTAEGGWNYPSSWGFQMGFSAVFERAALDYDSRQGLFLTTENSEPVRVSVSSLEGYHHELAYFIGCLERGEPVTISTGAQAAASLDLVLTEIESASHGQPISLST